MVKLKKSKNCSVLALILTAIILFPVFISSCQTIQHVDRLNHPLATDIDIRDIEENTECTTIADNNVGPIETLPRDQVLFYCKRGMGLQAILMNLSW